MAESATDTQEIKLADLRKSERAVLRRKRIMARHSDAYERARAELSDAIAMHAELVRFYQEQVASDVDAIEGGTQ